MSVRPSKIIAGQEPDKTNEFLQSLGKAAAKGVRINYHPSYTLPLSQFVKMVSLADTFHNIVGTYFSAFLSAFKLIMFINRKMQMLLRRLKREKSQQRNQSLKTKGGQKKKK